MPWEARHPELGAHRVNRPYGLAAPEIGELAPATSARVQVLDNHEIAWDGNEDWFSRVFMLLDSTSGPWSTDGLWDSDASEWQETTTATWDSDATTRDLSYFRRSFRNFKAPDAYPVTIAVWLDDANVPEGYWDSPGTYDDGGLWTDDDGSLLYWTIGHVWDEEQWLGDGVDAWTEDEEELVPLDEEERWIDFAGE